MSEEQQEYKIEEQYKVQLKYILKPHQKLICIFDYNTHFDFFEKGNVIEYIGSCYFLDGKIKIFFNDLRNKKVHEILIDNIITEFKDYFALLILE